MKKLPFYFFAFNANFNSHFFKNMHFLLNCFKKCFKLKLYFQDYNILNFQCSLRLTTGPTVVYIYIYIYTLYIYIFLYFFFFINPSTDSAVGETWGIHHVFSVGLFIDSMAPIPSPSQIYTVYIRGVTVHKIHGSVRCDTVVSRFGMFSIRGAGQLSQCWKYFCFKPWRRANGFQTSTRLHQGCTRANFVQDLCRWTS